MTPMYSIRSNYGAVLAIVVPMSVFTPARGAGQTTTFPPPLHGEQLAFDAARARLVAFGGGASTDGGRTYVDFAETWEWDGARWSSVVLPEHSAGARWAHAMSYDPDRRVIVAYGGRKSHPRGEAIARLCDTWTYDGVHWTLAGAASCVSTRLGANLVHDPLRHAFLLLEGAAPVGTPMRPLRMWSWQGNDWMLVDSAGPRRDVGEQAAFDIARGVLVVPVNRGPDAGVWEWNGRAWIRHDASGPVNRNSYALTYDSHRRRVVLIGGEVERPGGRTVYSDVWTWDGARWAELKTTGASPEPRAYATLVHNPVTGTLLYFGGAGEAGNGLPELWELDHDGSWRLLGQWSK